MVLPDCWMPPRLKQHSKGLKWPVPHAIDEHLPAHWAVWRRTSLLAVSHTRLAQEARRLGDEIYVELMASSRAPGLHQLLARSAARDKAAA